MNVSTIAWQIFRQALDKQDSAGLDKWLARWVFADDGVRLSMKQLLKTDLEFDAGDAAEIALYLATAAVNESFFNGVFSGPLKNLPLRRVIQTDEMSEQGALPLDGRGTVAALNAPECSTSLSIGFQKPRYVSSSGRVSIFNMRRSQLSPLNRNRSRSHCPGHQEARRR
jgi:hypothetical protein